MLDMDEGLKVVGEATNGSETIEKTIALAPDVILMDIKMPGMDGIAATREIKERSPSVHVLVLSLCRDDYLRNALDAGASGYLLKDGDSDQVIRGIREVCDGLSPIAPALTGELLSEFARLSRQNRVSLLDERQQAIMKLIAEGLGGKKIGELLFLSTSTVKRETRRIFDKLGVDSRAHAVAETIRRGLLQVSPDD